MGDLGTTDIDYKALDNTSILLIPVGGVYTLGPQTARVVCEKIKPSLVIPMHFKTEKLGFDIAPVGDFASQFPTVEYLQRSQLEITSQELSGTLRIVVLKPSH